MECPRVGVPSPSSHHDASAHAGRSTLLRRLSPLLASSPPLRRLAWTGFVSSLGSTFLALSFGYLAYAQSHQALMPVLVAGAYSVGYGAVALPAGRLAQTSDRVRIILAANAAKVVIYAAILALSIAGHLSIAVMIVGGVTGGITSGMQFPAYQGLVRTLAPDNALGQTNALFSSLSSAANVIGALAGGVLLSTVGPDPLFAFNVLTYAPYMWAVARAPQLARRAREAPEHRLALPEVVRTVRARDALMRAVVLMALLELLAYPLVTVMPRLAADIGTSAHYYGFLAGAFYAGAMSVAFLLRRWRRRFCDGRFAAVALVGAGLSVVLLAIVGLVPDPSTALLLVMLVAAIAVTGVTLTTATAVLQAVAQLSSPRDVEGRILGFYALVTLITTTVGGLIVGSVGDVISIWVVLAITGGLLAIIGLVLSRGRAFAALNRPMTTDADMAAGAHSASSLLGGSQPLDR
jgi:MFS family permease